MSADATELTAAVIGLALVAGCALDVMLRPVPVLAPRAQRRRRHGLWAVMVLGYLVLLTLL
jgi:hypothetical protein